MSDAGYRQRVESQIAQYAQTINMHDLPGSFHFWSYNFIRPALIDVYGAESINEFYVKAFVEATVGVVGQKRILSVGCGDGAVEAEIARTLVARGERDFMIVATDLSAVQLERCVAGARRLDLENHFSIVECDLNSLAKVRAVAGPFDLIIANHSLHHIVELEGLFEFIYDALKDAGIFATNDMIGRNGHMRWPETAAIVRAIWPLLSPVQHYHSQLKRIEAEFLDHDCSTVGFEGIRAQDILPLILERFHARKFVGVGGFIDLFVDRGFGHGFKMEDEHDRALVMCVAQLNDILLDAGVVKPTLMLGYFSKKPCQERFYRSRSAASCARTAEPEWVTFYPEPNHIASPQVVETNGDGMRGQDVGTKSVVEERPARRSILDQILTRIGGFVHAELPGFQVLLPGKSDANA